MKKNRRRGEIFWGVTPNLNNNLLREIFLGARKAIGPGLESHKFTVQCCLLIIEIFQSGLQIDIIFFT